VPTATLGRGCNTTPVQPHRRPRATTVQPLSVGFAAAVRVAQAPREPRPRARRAGHVPRGSEGHAHPQGPSGRAAAAEGNTLLVFVCGVHSIGVTMSWLPRVGPPAALADGDAIPCRGRLPCCGGCRARMPVPGSRRAPRVVRQLLCAETPTVPHIDLGLAGSSRLNRPHCGAYDAAYSATGTSLRSCCRPAAEGLLGIGILGAGQVAPALTVITSKQRPRKCTIVGSDGREYALPPCSGGRQDDHSTASAWISRARGPCGLTLAASGATGAQIHVPAQGARGSAPR
jgi:hypothetical protein